MVIVKATQCGGRGRESLHRSCAWACRCRCGYIHVVVGGCVHACEHGRVHAGIGACMGRHVCVHEHAVEQIGRTEGHPSLATCLMVFPVVIAWLGVATFVFFFSQLLIMFYYQISATTFCFRQISYMYVNPLAGASRCGIFSAAHRHSLDTHSV